MRLMNDLKTRELVKEWGFKFTKSLGQNFLTDKQVVEDIIKGSGISSEDHVIEIGPGSGALTGELLKAAKHVTSVEIDKDLIPMLDTEFKNYENFTLINEDVLDIDFKDLLLDMPVKIVANLPYYVTTPILLKLLTEDFDFESITVMIQKEVAERICAEPGGKDYGALSLLVQYHTIPEIIRIVKPESFMPKPKVDSIVIKLIGRKGKKVHPKDEELFFKVIRQSFAMRRKTLNNTLKPLGYSPEVMAEAFGKAGIDPVRRGETLSMEEFCKLSDALLTGTRGGNDEKNR